MRVQELLDRLSQAARRARFQSTIYATIGDFELPAFTRLAEAEDAPHLYLSSGVHGDEPAGPLALLDLLKNKHFPSEISVTIVPVVNPTGLERKTRENAEGVDLNRDYGLNARSPETRAHRAFLEGKRFDLAICLHEDFEARGGYLYELRPVDCPSAAQPLLDAMEPYVGIDPASEIDGMPALNGLMQPPMERALEMADTLPEALLLQTRHSDWGYTLETPTSANIVRRVDAQVAAVRVAMKRLVENRSGQWS
jgi:hypothetical protein